jgi:hypothetical protein
MILKTIMEWQACRGGKYACGTPKPRQAADQRVFDGQRRDRIQGGERAAICGWMEQLPVAQEFTGKAGSGAVRSGGMPAE